MAMDREEAGPAAVASVGGVPLTAGDHVCALYRGHAERDQLLSPFFADGLRDGHICLLLAARNDGGAFSDAQAAELPSADGTPGHLQIKEPQESYLLNGTFDGDGMLDLLHTWSAGFRHEAGRFARLAADMSWAGPLVQPAFIQEVLRYETKATRWLRSNPLVGVCMYDLELFSGDLIVPMVKAHPKVWLGGRVVENPYCPAPGTESGPTARG